MTAVAFTINGKTVNVEAEPDTALLWVVREHLKPDAHRPSPIPDLQPLPAPIVSVCCICSKSAAAFRVRVVVMPVPVPSRIRPALHDVVAGLEPVVLQPKY